MRRAVLEVWRAVEQPEDRVRPAAGLLAAEGRHQLVDPELDVGPLQPPHGVGVGDRQRGEVALVLRQRARGLVLQVDMGAMVVGDAEDAQFGLAAQLAAGGRSAAAGLDL